MEQPDIRSLGYLRELSRLVSDWEEDAACQCCDWAVQEIEGLRATMQRIKAAVEADGQLTEAEAGSPEAWTAWQEVLAWCAVDDNVNNTVNGLTDDNQTCDKPH